MGGDPQEELNIHETFETGELRQAWEVMNALAIDWSLNREARRNARHGREMLEELIASRGEVVREYV